MGYWYIGDLIVSPSTADDYRFHSRPYLGQQGTPIVCIYVLGLKYQYLLVYRRVTGLTYLFCALKDV